MVKFGYYNDQRLSTRITMAAIVLLLSCYVRAGELADEFEFLNGMSAGSKPLRKTTEFVYPY